MARNVFREFLDLVPQQPLQAGTVLSVSGATCTVQLPGGGILQARGAASVGQQVYVRGGRIEGEAPTLTAVAIDV